MTNQSKKIIKLYAETIELTYPDKKKFEGIKRVENRQEMADNFIKVLKNEIFTEDEKTNRIISEELSLHLKNEIESYSYLVDLDNIIHSFFSFLFSALTVGSTLAFTLQARLVVVFLASSAFFILMWIIAIFIRRASKRLKVLDLKKILNFLDYQKSKPLKNE